MDALSITVVVAEEHTLVREGFARLCQSVPGCAVVAQCGDGREAFTLIHRFEPKIALLDLNIGVIHPLEVVQRLREAGSRTRFIVLATRRDRKTALECVRAGAAAYILKSGPLEEFYTAIQQVLSGDVYVSTLVEKESVHENGHGPRDPMDTLSTREHQVFSLLIEGVRAKEIAARLVLSPKTVDTYRASLMRKLDIHDLAGLVKFAIHRQLID